MVEASGLPWPKEVTWLLWGGLELFAFWKRWPSKGDSKTILSLISKDVEMKSMEDEMAVQKRKFEIILKGKDDEIDGGQKRLKTIEGERINFQKNLKQKDNDISKLQEEKNQLVKELCDVREQINNAEAKIKQRDEEIHHLQMKQTELASTLKLTESERLNFCNDLQTARKQLHDTEKKLFDTEKKLFEVREQKMEAEAEKHDALRRLSEMVSVKLRDNNPNIVDLNDENRPTKLAEMFSELYDNEWTAAYTVMEDNKFQDRQMIDFLLDVVMESYLFCKDEVEKSWIVVSEWFLDDGLPKVQQMRKALKDGRKVIALKRLQDIEQKYTSYIINICRHEPLKELLSSEDIRKYMALCLKLTLLMNTNDPPVYLECSGWKPLRDRQEEDNDLLESEHSVPELPGNGEQPKLQNGEDKDSSNVVGTDKQGEAPTGNGDTGQDFKKEGDTEDIGEEGIENDVQINEDNKQGEGDLDPEESQNAGCSGERQIDKNQHVSGNNEHPNSTVSTKPSENIGGTDSIKNMEAELDEQREAVKGNVDSGKDLNSDDTENKEAALKCQINATPGVIGDSEEERIENGGQIAETKLNSVNDAGQNVDAKREEPQETIAPFQSDDDQGSMTEKIAGEMENSKQPCQKASIDPGAASPTICEHDTQKAQIYDDNFEESLETTGRKDEKDMPESNDPNSECEPSVKQLDQQNDNDDSNKISEGELSNEETAVATRGEFEKDKYKEYTTRGKYTEFYVWPIMYLHKGGPMLGKGIAQGVKDSKAEPSDKPWAWWK